MLETLAAIAIICLAAWACFWIIDRVGLREPFRSAVSVVLAIVFILALLGVVGIGPGIGWR